MSRHSTTERIKMSRRPVIAILALLILGTGLAQEGIEREGYFEVRSASTQAVNGVHTLDARLQLVLSSEALAALESESTDPTAPEYASIKELLRVVDEYIPMPEREMDKPFMMSVEDVFSIKGRGTVVTGRIDRGVINETDGYGIR